MSCLYRSDDVVLTNWPELFIVAVVLPPPESAVLVNDPSVERFPDTPTEDVIDGIDAEAAVTLPVVLSELTDIVPGPVIDVTPSSWLTPRVPVC